MPTSASHYFAGTIRGAQRAGIDGDLLLENVELTREQVFDPQWRGNVELLAGLGCWAFHRWLAPNGRCCSSMFVAFIRR